MHRFRPFFRQVHYTLCAGIFLCGVSFSSLLKAEGSDSQMPVMRIVAVVNSAAISNRMLQGRIALTLAMSGAKDTPEMRRKAGPQVLRRLIDEQLKWQAAEKLRIKVSEEDVLRALRGLSFPTRQSKPGSEEAIPEVERFLQSRKIPMKTLLEQVRNELAWTRLVMKRIQPKVDIGEEDIDQAIEQLQNQARLDPEVTKKFPPLLRLYHIIYPLKPDVEREQAVQTVEQAIALRASVLDDCPAFLEAGQKVNRLSPVDRGMLPVEELHPAIREKLLPLRAGEITEPFRTREGVHLIMICGREQPLPPIDREMVRQGVFQEKLELEILEYLRTLRRDAFVEVR